MSTFGSHIPVSTSPAMGGLQHKFFFPNGFGASAVRHRYSYGGERGLWEVAVLGPDGRLNYDTPVTDDVLGYLTEADVASALDQIAALESVTR